MYEQTVYRLIHRYSPDKGIEEFQDIIIKEQCFNVYINDAYYRSICCTPSHLEELLIGHLAMEGVIAQSKDIEKIYFNEDTIKLSINRQPKDKMISETYDITCPAYRVNELMREHLNISDLHKKTGGVHVMSLASIEGLLVSREDVGRHNAVDKLYGYCLLNNVSCGDKIFLSSGRISNEIIQKLVTMGIKLAISRATVTSLGQAVAEQAGITVLGFARGDRFNIYTHPYRITAGEDK